MWDHLPRALAFRGSAHTERERGLLRALIVRKGLYKGLLTLRRKVIRIWVKIFVVVPGGCHVMFFSLFQRSKEQSNHHGLTTARLFYHSNRKCMRSLSYMSLKSNHGLAICLRLRHVAGHDRSHSWASGSDPVSPDRLRVCIINKGEVEIYLRQIPQGISTGIYRGLNNYNKVLGLIRGLPTMVTICPDSSYSS